MFDYTPVAHGLRLGRPDNRRYIYDGDRRDLAEHPQIMGPDAHGVYWMTTRAYVRDGKTLVIFEPVHPDNLIAARQMVRHDSA